METRRAELYLQIKRTRTINVRKENLGAEETKYQKHPLRCIAELLNPN